MAEYQNFELSGSIKVPSVQELAKEPLSNIPKRYSRSLETSVVTTKEIPVINLEILLSDDFTDLELNKLHTACAEWGFFHLVNHGVSIQLLENVKKEIQNFFDLPFEEKKKYKQLPNDTEGYGQSNVTSNEQKLDWSDMFFMHTLPVDIRKPHLLPQLPPTLRDVIEEYSLELQKLAMKLLEFMWKALKMDVNELETMYDEGIQAMRFNYYPPCPQPESAIGLTAHSDEVGLTILLQLSECDGLEIRKDGMWVPIKTNSNAFVVNIGDMLEIVTNGAYESVEHRAVVNSEKERLSIATFFAPRMDAVIRPSSNLITPENPAKYKSIITGNFLNEANAKYLDGKLQLKSTKI